MQHRISSNKLCFLQKCLVFGIEVWIYDMKLIWYMFSYLLYNSGEIQINRYFRWCIKYMCHLPVPDIETRRVRWQKWNKQKARKLVFEINLNKTKNCCPQKKSALEQRTDSCGFVLLYEYIWYTFFSCFTDFILFFCFNTH